MKKRNLLILAPFIAAITLTSCLKDTDIDPVTGKNSVLKIEGIKFQNLVGDNSTGLKGVSRFDFYIANGPNNEITDTSTVTQTFYLSNPSGYTQSYDFDTPEKTKKFKFSVYFLIEGQGYASGVSVSKLTYKWNGNTYLDVPLIFTTGDQKRFDTDSVVVNF